MSFDIAIARAARDAGPMASRYVVLRQRCQMAKTQGLDDSEEVTSSLIGAMAEIYKNLRPSQRDALAVLIANLGGEPVTVDEANMMAIALERRGRALVQEALRS